MRTRTTDRESLRRSGVPGAGRIILRHLTLLFAAVCLLWPSPVAAAQDDDETLNETDRADLTQRLPGDRKTTASLEQLRQSIDRGDQQSAIRELYRLRTAEPGLMVPGNSASEGFVPLYRAVFREFHRLPAAQRQQFRTTQEAVAGLEFQQAAERGELSEFVSVIHRFPGTRASLQACLLIALQHRDRGEALAAEVWALELDRDGVDPEFRVAAQQILTAAKAARTLSDSGDAHPPDETSQQRTWRDNRPQFLQWQYRTALSTRLQDAVSEFLTTCVQAGIVPRTSWHVDVDNGSIFRRTMRGVAAIDGRTGKPRWHYPLATNHETLLQEQRNTQRIFNPLFNTQDEAGARGRFRDLERTPLVDLFCRDGVQSGLTDDAERIYLVAEGSEVAEPTTSRRFFPGGMNRSVYRGSELIALEKESGRRVWTLGGQLTAQPQAAALAAAWFAGPPTVDRDRLYAVTEQNDAVFLNCLAAATGEQLWSLALAYPEQSIDNDPVRRLWAARVTVRDGLIWCPTTTGWLIAVDRLTRSVVWAGPLESPDLVDQQRVPVPRGRQFIRTEKESLISSWGPQPVFLEGGHLIVFPSESYDIRFFDPVTGSIRHRIEADPSSTLLHLNTQRMLIASGRLLKCYDIRTAELVWEQQLTDADGLPTGRGVESGQHLLLPTTSGSIAVIRLADGLLEETLHVPLSNPGWGHLVAMEADILSVAPDRVLRLSAQELNPDLRDPLELAAALAASGNWTQALEMLEQIPDTDRRQQQVHRIAFDCRYQLAVSDPDVHLAELQAAAAAPEERLQVDVLKTRKLLHDERNDEAATALLSILKQEPSLLLSNEFTPREVTPDEHVSTRNAPALNQQLPLTTWAARHLSELFACMEPDQRVTMLAELQQLPDRVLLQLSDVAAPQLDESRPQPEIAPPEHSSPADVTGLQSLLHQRMLESTSDETTLHLLLHSLESADHPQAADQLPASPIRLNAPLHAFRKLVENNNSLLQELRSGHGNDSDASTDWLAARALLLNCVALELAERLGRPLSDFDPAANSGSNSGSPESTLLSRTDLTAAFQQALRSRWDDWPIEPYRVTPFAQPSGMSSPTVDISPDRPEDIFLREFEWSVLNEPSRLRAARLADPNRRNWSIPAILGAQARYNNNDSETIHRCGSVLLVQTNTGITALSVLDQRVLWSRSHNRQARVIVTVGPAQPQFQEFEVGKRQQPSSRRMGALSVIPAGPRRVCLRFGNELEAVDLLTGHTLWKVAGDQPLSQVVATSRLLFLNSIDDRHAWCFRLNDGTPVETDVTGPTLNRTLTATDSALVVWRPREGQEPGPELEWFNPHTGVVDHRLSLADSESFHFASDQTLVGVSRGQSVQVVDLQTAERFATSFAVAGEDAATQAKQDQAGDEKLDSLSSGLWTPDRVFVVADPLTLYVLNNASAEGPRAQQGFDRHGSAFEGGVRAVDRQSGEVRWTIDGDGQGIATSRKPGLPVMVIIHEERLPGPPNQQQISRTAFRGIGKMSGAELFDAVIPTRFNVTAAWISSDRHQALNIQVYGNHVRMEPQNAMSIIAPGETDAPSAPPDMQ